MQSQLLGDRLPLLHRLPRGAVDDTHEDPGAFDVAQELVAQALALVGALDQPGHVRDDREPLSVGIERDHAEVWADRRERVGPDFGPGLGECRQQRRLAGVRRADQADVGDELQLELDPALLAGRSLLGVARRAVGRRREAGISSTAATAAGDDEAGIGVEQLADPFAFRMSADDRPRRDANEDVRGAATVGSAPGAAAARVGSEVAAALEIAEGRLAGLDDQDDVATLAPVAAVGASPRDVCLAAERARAVATGTSGDEDPRAVSEAGHQERSIRAHVAPRCHRRDAGEANRR